MNYFNYYTEIEEHFQRARGTGLFLLSPLDWALIESWNNAGVPLEAVLRRLKDERDQADARYNEALTAVDRAIRGAPSIPHPPPALDDHQIAELNDAWNILPAPPRASGR